jgi:hypothetical protein
MVNGYYPVIQALAHGLDIRLNQRCVLCTQLELFAYHRFFERLCLIIELYTRLILVSF